MVTEETGAVLLRDLLSNRIPVHHKAEGEEPNEKEIYYISCGFDSWMFFKA
jgi:hypothetical protein